MQSSRCSIPFADTMLRPSLCFVSEIEAKKACDWLRAAGFPQYAQLYEGESCFLLCWVWGQPSRVRGVGSGGRTCSSTRRGAAPPSSCCPPGARIRPGQGRRAWGWGAVGWGQPLAALLLRTERGEQPGSPAPRPAAGQQPAQLQTARSGLLVAGPGLGMSSGSPARPACHSSPSSGDEQKVPILPVGLVVYRLSARGGCRERSRSAGRGQDGGDCLLITWLFVKTLSPQSRLWCGEPAMLLTSLHS